MKLVASIKLKPSKEQAQSLKETLERCNAACNWIAKHGFENGKTRQFDLHKLTYSAVRAGFGLAAQVTVRCIAKVADAFEINRRTVPSFRRLAAQPYDKRIFSIKGDMLSIWTLAGRIKLPFVTGGRQKKALVFRKGEADLAFVRGKWFLICTCEVPETEEFDPEDWIGVDLGIANIAATSDGVTFCGDTVLKVRDKYATRRGYHQRRAATATTISLTHIATRSIPMVS